MNWYLNAKMISLARMGASMTVTMMYIVLRRSKDTIKMSKYEKYARALRMTTQDTKFY